jgi:transketolase
VADAKSAVRLGRRALRGPRGREGTLGVHGLAGAQARAEWQARLDALPERRRAEFERVFAYEPPARFARPCGAAKKAAAADPKPVATRKSSEIALEAVNAAMPETIGGSAGPDRAPTTPDQGVHRVRPRDRKGRYVHYGIREHGMAAAMNGMAVHGGVRPMAARSCASPTTPVRRSAYPRSWRRVWST